MESKVVNAECKVINEADWKTVKQTVDGMKQKLERKEKIWASVLLIILVLTVLCTLYEGVLLRIAVMKLPSVSMKLWLRSVSLLVLILSGIRGCILLRRKIIKNRRTYHDKKGRIRFSKEVNVFPYAWKRLSPSEWFSYLRAGREISKTILNVSNKILIIYCVEKDGEVEKEWMPLNQFECRLKQGIQEPVIELDTEKILLPYQS